LGSDPPPDACPTILKKSVCDGKAYTCCRAGELLAVTSLSRLWQQQGKKDEARQMLAEIYGWFTEGFDTKGLQEAKELLEELSHCAIE
jgi:predicted ATPase